MREHDAGRPKPDQVASRAREEGGARAAPLPENSESYGHRFEAVPALSGAAEPNAERRANQTGIPAPLLRRMEGFFAHDFSSVRVHSDSTHARSMNALAYTRGDELHFAPGRFRPGTQEGDRLIGHELSHVVQQRSQAVTPTLQAKSGEALSDSPELEREADRLGAEAAAYSAAPGDPPPPPRRATGAHTPVIQRALGFEFQARFWKIVDSTGVSVEARKTVLLDRDTWHLESDGGEPEFVTHHADETKRDQILRPVRDAAGVAKSISDSKNPYKFISAKKGLTNKDGGPVAKDELFISPQDDGAREAKLTADPQITTGIRYERLGTLIDRLGAPSVSTPAKAMMSPDQVDAAHEKVPGHYKDDRTVMTTAITNVRAGLDAVMRPKLAALDAPAKSDKEKGGTMVIMPPAESDGSDSKRKSEVPSPSASGVTATASASEPSAPPAKAKLGDDDTKHTTPLVSATPSATGLGPSALHAPPASSGSNSVSLAKPAAPPSVPAKPAQQETKTKLVAVSANVWDLSALSRATEADKAPAPGSLHLANEISDVAGILALLATYLIKGKQLKGKGRRFIKDFPLLGKSHLGVAVKESPIVTSPVGWLTYKDDLIGLVIAAASRGPGEQVHPGEKGSPTIGDWLEGLFSPEHIDLLSILDNEEMDDSMGFLRKVEKVGPDEVPAPIVEFRRMQAGIPYDMWGELAEQMRVWIAAVNNRPR